jgi:hypothetical protein
MRLLAASRLGVFIRNRLCITGQDVEAVNVKTSSWYSLGGHHELQTATCIITSNKKVSS